MGRTKQAPTRRLNTDNQGGELLGRHTEDEPVAELLAKELGISQDTRESHPRPSASPPKRKKKSSPKPTLREEESDLWILPSAHNDAPPRLMYRSSQGGNTTTDDDQDFAANLRWLPLPPATCIAFSEEHDDDDHDVESNYNNNNMPGQQILTIRTAAGARTIWRLCAADCDAVGALVEQGLVRMQIVPRLTNNDDSPKDNNSSAWHLQLQLDAAAFRACCPAALPAARVERAKKYLPAVRVHRFLAALYPDTVIADAENNNNHKAAAVPSNNNNDVSAHRVYSLTDNVQIQRKLLLDTGTGNVKKKSANIPGLVPKLRPYQQAAVDWMLHRERRSSDDGEEWRLAWVVIHRDGVVPLTTALGRRNAAEDGIYFCPFVGWLARDWHEAKLFTLGTIDHHRHHTVQGGILAESMGLGKTVEVIACILSNPKPCSRLAPQNLFGDADVAGTTNNVESMKASSTVDDYADFGDQDDDSSIDDDEGSIVATSGTARVHVVTPESHSEKEISHEEWVEDTLIGSCVCGSLITLDDMRRQPTVVCCSCREPMHMQCAGFATERELQRCTDGLVLRQLYLNTSTATRISRNQDCCPCCVGQTGGLIESRATLIVTPPAILDQWKQEIEKHAKMANGNPMQIAVYRGVHQISGTVSDKGKARDGSMKLLHAAILADTDIVLASFDALMADLCHPVQADDQARGARKRKRYRVVPSPLLKIKWWRICLDEAQRVETPTAKSAQMALKLSARYHWCVSGTPIGRGKLEDLFGLLRFLCFSPFNSKVFFDKCFSSQNRGLDDRIVVLLKNVFWRSTRECPEIRAQMGIPEQEEKKVVLDFSSVERHFYNRQRDSTVLAATEINDRRKRQKTKLNKLAEQLHSLRAACCHPQVGSGGIGRSKQSKREGPGSSLSTQVMSMHQILCKLIDDARLKCEEAQRVAIMHTNAAGALTRLRVDAKSRGVLVDEDDSKLFKDSFKLYDESLQLASSNATPTLVLGEAVLFGSRGFQSPRKTLQGGSAVLDWVSSGDDLRRDVWARLDFDEPRRVNEIRARVCCAIPPHVVNTSSSDVRWEMLRPISVSLQVSNMAYGGEFVTVSESQLSTDGDSSEWVSLTGFLVSKSKAWRILVNPCPRTTAKSSTVKSLEYIGLEVEILEASIGFDPLQRLHCLHNAAVSLEYQHDRERLASEESVDDLKAKATEIEMLYTEVKRSTHRECHRQLRNLRERRELAVSKLNESCPGRPRDLWEECWYDDFLVLCHLQLSPSKCQQMVDRLRLQLDSSIAQTYGHASVEEGVVPFHDFHDINGLRVGLQFRINGIRDGVGTKSPSREYISTTGDDAAPPRRRDYFRCTTGGFAKCLDEVNELSDQPSEKSIVENRCCRVCKADWNQTGPECRHCKVGSILDELIVDKVTLRVLKALHGQCKATVAREKEEKSISQDIFQSFSHLEERAALFFDALESERQERNAGSKLWKIHMELLNDLDELNQCKSTIRMVHEGEDLAGMTDDELNAVVQPFDIMARYHEHSAKQAMALGDLRRARSTLTYLRNQSLVRKESEKDETCMVCLSDFSESERAVLKCGHSFHYTPCLEKLRSITGEICCPLRCKMKTKYSEVLIATEKRTDDGSASSRTVKGSWGTKVARLVSDVLDVHEQGEKCIVFSQWEDMLDICEKALVENGVYSARSSGPRYLSDALNKFRSEECAALLLNVKSAGEGLTIVEATHVFMVEPLLNHGLDSQAIARVNRIGQTRKTVVHRYLIKGTIETKIDALRMTHSADEVEDSIHGAKRTKINAGGIDGGFGSSEELMALLTDTGNCKP